MDVRTKSIDSEYQRHKVEDLKPAHAVVVLKEPVHGFTTFHKKENDLTIAAGTTLLVRRKVVFDGSPHVVATDCGPGLQSYLIAEKDLSDTTKAGKEEGSAWERYREWFEVESGKEAALRFGARERLNKEVVLTIDLCWSLRAYEAKLFQSVKGLAACRKRRSTRCCLFPAVGSSSTTRRCTI